MKNNEKNKWMDFPCTLEPVMAPVITIHGVKCSAIRVRETYEVLCRLKEYERICQKDLPCPFFANQVLVPANVLGWKEESDGDVYYVLTDRAALNLSYQVFLAQVRHAEQSFSLPFQNRGKVTVQMAPILALTVSLPGGKTFPASLIRETFDIFSTVYPIPVPGDQEGRLAADFPNPSFVEYLASRGICGKARSRKGQTSYWIKDPEGYQGLVDQIESLVTELEGKL